MKIIGFDPSLSSTGYAVVEIQNNKILSAGLIKTNPKIDTHERIFEIYKNVKDIIAKHDAEHAALEESFYGKNVKTSNLLAQVRMVIIIACMEHGMSVSLFSPNSIKKCITGRGHASKEQVLYMVREIFGLEESLPDDVSDALATAYTFITRTYNELSH